MTTPTLTRSLPPGPSKGPFVALGASVPRPSEAQGKPALWRPGGH